MFIDVEIAFDPKAHVGARVALDDKEGTITEGSGAGFTVEFDDGTTLVTRWAELAERALRPVSSVGRVTPSIFAGIT